MKAFSRSFQFHLMQLRSPVSFPFRAAEDSFSYIVGLC